MDIDTDQLLKLREMTGAGMLDAKKALEEADGDMDAAAEALRKKGIAQAKKKAGRETGEGLVHSYIHNNGKLGAMVEVMCETDFVARNEVFQDFCHDLAMHISAADPLYVSRDDVPEEVVDKQEEMIREETDLEGKPDDVIDQIIEGKLNKYFQQVVLMEQPFIKDEDLTIEDLVKEKISTLGENINIARFCRFSID
jgi:elongation factor Ts